MSNLTKEDGATVGCTACPRRCGVDREKEKGFCGVPAAFVVARAAKHFWEEPPISGKEGSGAVFFSGCSLRCVFCQNHAISHGCFGKEVTDDELLRIFDRLIESGVHNLNLVTPSHYAERLARVLKKFQSPVPVVYNSSGYDSVESLQKLVGLVDIWMPDLKFATREQAQRYAGTADYFPTAMAAIQEMKRQQPEDVFQNGLLQKGVVLRHLILPGNTNRSVELLRAVAERFGTKTIVSLMAQYTPCGDLAAFPELQRRITAREYEKVVAALENLGFENAYVQDRASASEAFIPAFDLTGVQVTDASRGA